MSRHVITISELGDRDLNAILEAARAPLDDSLLVGQGVALVFERPSLRTRAACSSAVHELGGYVTFFSDDEIGLDSRESAEDVGRTIDALYSVCAMRIRHHSVFHRIRRATKDRLSLVNLLSDVAHPTQAIADVLTIADHFAKGDPGQLAGLRVAYVGDATNVTRSLAVALTRLGVEVVVGAPEGYQLVAGTDEDPLALEGAKLRLTSSATEAVRGADVVYTDAWVSMGFEEETQRRRTDLADFRVDESLLEGASPDAVVLHCLPAHRGDEITDAVMDGPRSLVWQQVTHRRSAMVGALRWIKDGE